MCIGGEDPKDLERRLGIARRQQERQKAKEQAADEAARKAVEGEAA